MSYHRKPAVYAIKNTVTDDVYVGSSENVSQRISSHKWHLRNGRHPNAKLQRSWDKYGEQSFIFEVIEYIEDKAKLAAVEQLVINQLAPSYNILLLAYSPRGYRHTEEAKEKLRKAHADGRYEGQRAYMRTRPITETFLQAVTKNIQYERTDEHRRAVGERSRNRSAESNRRIGEANRQHRLGKKHSPETIEKMRAKRQAWWDRKNANKDE